MTVGIVEKLIAAALGYFIFQPDIFNKGIQNMNWVLLLKLILFFILLTILERKYWWYFIVDKFNSESRRQSKQISGKWKATELFAFNNDPNDKDDFIVKIECKGGIVTGTHECIGGFDLQGTVYTINGTYKDHILTFTWMQKDKSKLESGTITAIFSDTLTDKLEGHGLYYEADDGKIHTSTFTATRIKE